MANMPKTTKRRIRIRVELDVCRKVVKEWRKPEDKDDNLAFIRCLEDAVRDVELTVDDWRMIYEEQARNEADRKRGGGK